MNVRQRVLAKCHFLIFFLFFFFFLFVRQLGCSFLVSLMPLPAPMYPIPQMRTFLCYSRASDCNTHPRLDLNWPTSITMTVIGRCYAPVWRRGSPVSHYSQTTIQIRWSFKRFTVPTLQSWKYAKSTTAHTFKSLIKKRYRWMFNTKSSRLKPMP